MTARAITISGFIAVIAALIAPEMLARRRTGSIPAAGERPGPGMRPADGRALVLPGGLRAGWHCFAR